MYFSIFCCLLMWQADNNVYEYLDVNFFTITFINNIFQSLKWAGTCQYLVPALLSFNL